MSLTVGQVARLSGVTVRTLHHYDRIGLLEPSGRTRAGYRIYDDRDLERLQEVLFYRELGFGLDRIREMTVRPDHDRGAALEHQRGLLEARRQHLQAMIDAVDHALEAHERGIAMNRDEMFEVFGDHDPTAHQEEVERHWSGPLLDESRRRTRKYGKERWLTIKEEEADIVQAFVEAMQGGHAPEAEPATTAAERHRTHIDRWYYPCSHPMHVGLAQMYVADPRFREYWDRHADGLAEYVSASIEANAERPV